METNSGNLSVIENREEIKPNEEFSLLPDGVYLAQVINSEVKNTAKGDGLVLKTEHVITSGEFQGRIIYTNFNIKNANEKAQQIGLGMLASLSKAVGFPNGIPADSCHLHDKVHAVKIVVKEGGGMNPSTGKPYSPKNEIKAFYTKDKMPKSETKAAGQPSFVDEGLPDFMK